MATRFSQTAADIDDPSPSAICTSASWVAMTTPRIIDVDKRVNVRQRHGFQWTAAGYSGVVDQNVQPAEGPGRMGDGILNRLRAGAVGLYRFRPYRPRAFISSGDRLGFIDRFFIRNNHSGAGRAPATSAMGATPTHGWRR
ncbi:Uncharacterised protein [Klebsiella pneumoniae]|uniref:Uncharacterized protein n=1 Tax=Klebsiella pneumoniae TaxID=573 RepID=A0A447S2T1_KLEPN|nr:Uncharacterised protein [Klebsiella pneumoniae]